VQGFKSEGGRVKVTENKDKGTTTVSCGGCGCFGGGLSIAGIIAFVLSYSTFHSIWWALLAAVFGWAYIIYWLIYYWK
jgi:hypothetical protein